MKSLFLNNDNINTDQLNTLINNNNCLIGVFSKQCIHCINMKPEWNKLKIQLSKVKTKCLLIEIDSEFLSKLNNQEIANNIDGLPCIMSFKKGKLNKKFDKQRTVNHMFNFIKPLLQVKSVKKNKLYNKTYKLKKNLSVCKHSKNGKSGCRICCSRFTNKKTKKRCIKKCMKK